MGIIDTIIILLFILFIIIGFIRGFLKQVLNSLAWVIAMVASISLYVPASTFLLNTSLGSSLGDTIYKWIAGNGDLFTTPVASMTEEYLIQVLTELKIPNVFHNIIIGLIDFSDFQNISISEYLSPKITSILLMVISFIIIYLVVFIVVKILAKVFGNIVRGSALGFIDGTLGAIWGAIKVTILVSLFMLGLSFIVTMPFGDAINEWITVDMKLTEEGFGIAKFFYENNPLLFVLSKLSIEQYL